MCKLCTNQYYFFFFFFFPLLLFRFSFFYAQFVTGCVTMEALTPQYDEQKCDISLDSGQADTGQIWKSLHVRIAFETVLSNCYKRALDNCPHLELDEPLGIVTGTSEENLAHRSCEGICCSCRLYTFCSGSIALVN